MRGLKFAERGSHDLKGIPGKWDLFAARHKPLATAAAAGKRGTELISFTEGALKEKRRSEPWIEPMSTHAHRDKCAYTVINLSRILSRLLEGLAADQHAADFGGAGANFIKLGVAQQAAGRDNR